MERERRRRGRRRERRRQATPPPQPQRERQEPLEVGEESQAPGVLPRRITFWRRRRPKERRRAAEKRKQEERRVTPSTRPVSPLAFWRRGPLRTFRERPLPRQTVGRLWRRLTGFYFPPWVPVATIIFVVFAILGAVFFIRQAGAVRPLANQDHWHAAYTTFTCGQRQPVIREFDAPEGVHTHGDGIVHIHPFGPTGEGAGAAIGRFFEYAGGKLTDDSLRYPGEDREWKNGDPCPDGKEGVVQILKADGGIHPVASFNQLIATCNELPNSSFEEVNRRYIPKDGDCLRMLFGPPEFQPTPVPSGELTPVPEPTPSPTPSPTPAGE